MATTAIININQQMQIHPISYNWGRFSVDGTGVMTNYMLALQDVENQHLKKMLGRDLLLDIKTNPTNYTEVLTGGTYELKCGGSTREIPFEGLRFIAAYFISSLYINMSYKQDSFTGMVKKKQEEATGLTSAERREERTRLENIALDEWAQLRAYLDQNTGTYPLWEIYKKAANTTTPLFMGVRKTFYR